MLRKTVYRHSSKIDCHVTVKSHSDLLGNYNLTP